MRVRKWEERNPWYKFYNRMITRCKPYREYGKRGIKVLVSKDDVRDVWFRDKAYLMDNPSLDRIDGRGDYSKDNIQFIEYLKNIEKKSLFSQEKMKARSVKRISLDGKSVRIFRSVRMAAKSVGIHSTYLSKYLLYDLNRNGWGYRWEFV